MRSPGCVEKDSKRRRNSSQSDHERGRPECRAVVTARTTTVLEPVLGSPRTDHAPRAGVPGTRRADAVMAGIVVGENGHVRALRLLCPLFDLAGHLTGRPEGVLLTAYQQNRALYLLDWNDCGGMARETLEPVPIQRGDVAEKHRGAQPTVRKRGKRVTVEGPRRLWIERAGIQPRPYGA